MVFALYKRGKEKYPRSFGVKFADGISTKELDYMLYMAEVTTEHGGGDRY